MINRTAFAIYAATAAVLFTGCVADSRARQFEGVCLGEPYPEGTLALCGELFNSRGRAFCNMHNGCEWEDCGGSCGYCNGSPLGCRSRDDATGCAAEPGCRWFAPPACASWEDCVVTWLQTGGCEELEMNIPGAVGYGDYIDGMAVEVTFSDHCR